jgi:hypothetical protein
LISNAFKNIALNISSMELTPAKSLAKFPMTISGTGFLV